MSLRNLMSIPAILAAAGTVLSAGQGQPANNVKIPIVDRNPSMHPDSFEGWEGAFEVSDFHPWYPTDTGDTPAKTDVKMLWGKDALYVMVLAHDPNPAKIRSFPVRRDGLTGTAPLYPQFGQDVIRVDLDPTGTGASAVTLSVNPSGSQEDGKTSNGSYSDNSFDLDWTAATHVTADGYIAKFRIPLNSLQGSKSNWLVRVSRAYPREHSYLMVWPQQPSGRDCTLCSMASINPPGDVKTSAPFYLIPFAAFSQTKTTVPPPPVVSAAKKTETDVGFDARFAVASASFEATYKPDFSAVEADVDPLVVNSRFGVAFAEKRPFFMNGMDVFGPSAAQAQFYSRSILTPKWAIKGNGNERWGSWTVLAGQDEHGGLSFSASDAAYATTSNDLVAGVQVATDEKGSYASFIGTERRLVGLGDKNETGGLYVNQKLGAFSVSASRINSYDKNTFDGTSMNGFSDSGSIIYSDRTNYLEIYSYRTSPGLRLGVGFVNLNGYSFEGGTYRRTFYSKEKTSLISRIAVRVTIQSLYDWNRIKFQDIQQSTATIWIRGGFRLALTYDLSGREWVDGSKFKSYDRMINVQYFGIPGVSFNLARREGKHPDYLLLSQTKESSNLILVDGNLGFIRVKAQYLDDEFADDATSVTTLKAKRLFGAIEAAFPNGFYAKAVFQDSLVNRSFVGGSKTRIIYNQFLFGWQPTAFTNCYIGYSTNRKDKSTLSWDDRSEGLFAKVSKSFRF